MCTSMWCAKAVSRTQPPDPHTALPAGSAERRFVIKGDGSAALRGVIGTDLTWNFTAIPDRRADH